MQAWKPISHFILDTHCSSLSSAILTGCLLVLMACAPPLEEGTYSGRVSLRTRLDEFIATNEEGKEIKLTKSGPHELIFSFGNVISHLDYEDDVIIIRESNNVEWTAKSIKNGFELDDGSILEYENCKGWELCLVDSKTREPMLKGSYSLSGSNVRISLWIAQEEKHKELLGLMANGLINKSRGVKQSNDSSLKTIAAPVWAH